MTNNRNKHIDRYQAMKFGQIIEENARNIFLKNHTQIVVENLFPDPFLKHQNWVYLWINSLKFSTVLSIVYQAEDYRNILKLSRRPLGFTWYKGFLKNKTRSGTTQDFFIRKMFIRKWSSKTPKPKKNVKNISSLKCLSCNFSNVSISTF